MKKMKKMLALCLALLMVLSLAACSVDGNNTANNGSSANNSNNISDPNTDSSGGKEIAEFGWRPTEPAPAELTSQTFKIGFTTNNATSDAGTNAHWQAMQDAGEYYGQELVMLDPQGDPNTQASQIENMIEMDVDVIICRATNTTSVIPAIKKAHDAGIPVLIIANNIDESGYEYISAYHGVDDYSWGVTVTEEILNYYDGKDQINILELQHTPGTSYGILRGQSLRDTIEGTNAVIMDSQTAEGSREKAQQITETWLLKYNPGEIDAIYVQGDGMVHGVIDAIDAAGRTGEFIVCAMGMSGRGWDAIKAGKLHCSTVNDNIGQAYDQLELAIRLAKGEEVDFNNYLPSVLVTIDNANGIGRPPW